MGTSAAISSSVTRSPRSFALRSLSLVANYSHKFLVSLLHFSNLRQPPQPFCSYFEWEADQQREIPLRMRSAWATTPLMSFLCNIRLPTSQCSLVVDCPQWAQPGRFSSCVDTVNTFDPRLWLMKYRHIEPKRDLGAHLSHLLTGSRCNEEKVSPWKCASKTFLHLSELSFDIFHLFFFWAQVVKEAFTYKYFNDCLHVFSLFMQQQWPPVVMLCHHTHTLTRREEFLTFHAKLCLYISADKRNKVGTLHETEATTESLQEAGLPMSTGDVSNRGRLLCCARLHAVCGQSLCWDLDESLPFIVSRQSSVVGWSQISHLFTLCSCPFSRAGEHTLLYFGCYLWIYWFTCSIRKRASVSV